MTISATETPKLSAKALKAIDLFLEEFYPEAKKAGEELAKCRMDKTQVRGLENIIVSTRRFSEIVNYIKNQAGKEKKDNKWRKLAPILLGQLEKVENKAIEIVPDNPAEQLEAKLQLAKGWARQVAAHYLYEFKEEGKKS